MSLHAFRKFSPVMQLYWVLKHGTFLTHRWDAVSTEAGSPILAS
jgi:hypothetical protein